VTAERSGAWERIRYDVRILLLALLVGLPGVAAALGLLWLGPFSLRLRWTLSLVVVPSWVVLSVVLRERVIRPLQTLSNMLAAFREGDFSIRARGAGTRDPLALTFLELNALERVLREQRLGAVEASTLLQRVLEEIDVAVFAFDESEELRLTNRAAERVLGQSSDRVLGKTASDLRLRETLEGEAPRTLELSHPGGTGRWELQRNVIRMEGQRLTLVVLSDLSRALREEERQAWRRLVRVLGHEINNSLAPIKSISASLRGLLGRDPRPSDWDEDVERGLEVIAGRAESLSRFMGAYARLARLPRPELGDVDVEEWVRHVARLETRLDVAVRDGPEVTIRADRDQLEQALINLVGNAADAALETGGGVEIGWTLRSGTVHVLVEDEGPGLPDTGNLFVPFYTTKPEGSGIGLVLSRQIAESHGGSLTLEDRGEGGGARARLVLPLDPEAEED